MNQRAFYVETIGYLARATRNPRRNGATTGDKIKPIVQMLSYKFSVISAERVIVSNTYLPRLQVNRIKVCDNIQALKSTLFRDHHRKREVTPTDTCEHVLYTIYQPA